MNPFSGYRITSPFGVRKNPFGSGKVWHTGIDLVTYPDGPIYAFTEGTVIFAKMGTSGSGFGGYGNVVAIQDKNNRLQVYAHLSAVTVRVGVKVAKGQLIGKQGSTGQSTGQHLHFEVRKTAQDKAPYGWIADRQNNCLDPTEYLQDYYAAEEVKTDMTKDDATKITAILGGVYNTAKAVGVPAAALTEIGRLADEVRVAAGIPKQNL